MRTIFYKAVRVPSDLYEELRLWAQSEHRSTTNLIVWLLRRAVSERDR
jgi:hypothetical protein